MSSNDVFTSNLLAVSVECFPELSGNIISLWAYHYTGIIKILISKGLTHFEDINSF